MSLKIRRMSKDDWTRVSSIYQQGMDTNLATFETTCPSYEAFDQSHVASCRYVIMDDDIVIGWAALSPVSSRCVYRGVAEVSIYVDEANKGKGAGAQLLAYLAEQSEQAGYWTLQAGIMENNTASIRLHEKCGFRTVGYREKIGKDRSGNWRNTVLMERRSKSAQLR